MLNRGLLGTWATLLLKPSLGPRGGDGMLRVKGGNPLLIPHLRFASSMEKKDAGGKTTTKRFKQTTPSIAPIRLCIESRIEKFNTLLQVYKSGMDVWSAGVVAPQLPEIVWKLKVKPKDEGLGKYGCCCFYVQLSEPGRVGRVNAIYQIFLQTADGSRTAVDSPKAAVFVQDSFYGGRVKKDKVKSLLHPDGSLLVVAEIDMYPEEGVVRAPQASPGGEGKSSGEMATKLAEALYTGLQGEFSTVDTEEPTEAITKQENH